MVSAYGIWGAAPIVNRRANRIDFPGHSCQYDDAGRLVIAIPTNTIRAILRKHAADDESALRATSVGLRAFQASSAALDIESELLERVPYSSKAKTPYLELTVVDPSADGEDNEYGAIWLDLEFIEQQLLISQSSA